MLGGGGGEGEVSQRLASVERGDLIVTVSGSGTFEVTHDANLYFTSGGTVEKVYVEEGDEVEMGEELAKLDTSTLELALIQAQAARDEAAYNLHQLKHVMRAASDRVKIAELQLEAAEWAVAEAQKKLDEAIITAPFSGIITSIGADEGDVLPSPSMAPRVIIYMIDASTLELKVDIDETDIASVEPGQGAILDIDALPDLELEGEVTEISTVPTTEGGVVFYQVTITLGAFPVSGLRVGMSATADIIIHYRGNVLIVPERAIQKDDAGNPIVKVMVNEEAQERPVVLGISDGFNIEVSGGVSEGEVVVVELRSKSEGAGGLFFGQ